MRKIEASFEDVTEILEDPKYNCEYIDILEGSLIDDLFFSFDGGYMVCFEKYLNCWSSGYTVFIYKESEADKAYKKWEKYKEKYLKLYPEEAAKYE